MLYKANLEKKIDDDNWEVVFSLEVESGEMASFPTIENDDQNVYRISLYSESGELIGQSQESTEGTLQVKGYKEKTPE